MVQAQMMWSSVIVTTCPFQKHLCSELDIKTSDRMCPYPGGWLCHKDLGGPARRLAAVGRDVDSHAGCASFVTGHP